MTACARRWRPSGGPCTTSPSSSSRPVAWGVEALIRGSSRTARWCRPIEFIPLAEELGLIELIGDWVVRELVYQAQAWRELDIDLEIGFNLSPRQFWQPDLSERILRASSSGGVDPATCWSRSPRPPR